MYVTVRYSESTLFNKSLYNPSITITMNKEYEKQKEIRRLSNKVSTKFQYTKISKYKEMRNTIVDQISSKSKIFSQVENFQITYHSFLRSSRGFTWWLTVLREYISLSCLTQVIRWLGATTFGGQKNLVIL